MEENPYMPPHANLIDKEEKTIELASRGRRLLAVIIDGLIGMAAVLPIMYFTGYFEGFPDNQEISFQHTALMALVGLGFFVVIHGKWLVTYGQTVGKRLLGIKFTDLEGNVPTIGRHLVPRYAFTTLIVYIPLIGNILSLIDSLSIFKGNRRCIHDYIGKTMVINQ